MNALQELLKETVRERTEELPSTLVPWAALQRRRRQHSLQVGGTLAAVAVACGAVLVAAQLPPSRSADPRPADVISAIAAPVKLSGLVGAWTVDAAGAKDTTIRVGADTAALQGRCGDLEASWLATSDGQFTAALSFGDMCGKGDDATVPELPSWLTDAVRLRADGAGWTLLGREGAVTARLTRDRDVAQPKLTAEDAARLDRTLPPLPAGKRPVTAAQLVGTWVPESLGRSSDRPLGVPGHTQVTFGPDGGSGAGPHWLLDPLGGVVLPHGGPRTLICATLAGEPGCADVPGWFEDARVAYEQGQLVLYDASGKAVHRLVRA